MAAIAAAEAHDGVFATVGLHPHDAVNGVDTIVDLLDTEGIVAVGECGLDYYYDHSPRDVQQRVFAEQIALANARELPLVIHTRDAWDDTFAVLADVGVPARTVFHCFTGGPDEARRALDIGAHLLDLCTRDMSNGGRGIGNMIESAFINPLGRALFRLPLENRASVIVSRIAEDENRIVSVTLE